MIPRYLTSRRILVVPAALSKESKKLFSFFFLVALTLVLLQVSVAGGREKNQAQGFFYFYFYSFLLCFVLLFFYYLKKRGDFQLHTEKTHCLACSGFLCLLEWKITHRHNTEKYYCQRFPEMPSRSPSVLPRREAVGCFSVCFLFFCLVFFSPLLGPSSAILCTYKGRTPRRNSLSHVVAEPSAKPGMWRVHGAVGVRLLSSAGGN